MGEKILNQKKDCKFKLCCLPGDRQNINFVSSAMKEKINISTSLFSPLPKSGRLLLAGKNIWCNFWCGCFHKAAVEKRTLSLCSIWLLRFDRLKFLHCGSSWTPWYIEWTACTGHLTQSFSVQDDRVELPGHCDEGSGKFY